jgi:RNase H-fold protein (predicted Holliday junction resolvase)
MLMMTRDLPDYDDSTLKALMEMEFGVPKRATDARKSTVRAKSAKSDSSGKSSKSSKSTRRRLGRHLK